MVCWEYLSEGSLRQRDGWRVGGLGKANGCLGNFWSHNVPWAARLMDSNETCIIMNEYFY